MTTIGILGAGQLGRMLALAGYPLGLCFRFFDPAVDSPAGQLAPHVAAAYDDWDALRQFSDGVDVFTYEFENVPVETVRFLEQFAPVFPPPVALEKGQDRWVEKNFFRALGIPTPGFSGLVNGLVSGQADVVNGLLSGQTDGNGQADVVNGLLNGQADGNGLVSGQADVVNGLVNGQTDGSGQADGSGLVSGLVNGLLSGQTDGNGQADGSGLVSGLVNGLLNGQTDGNGQADGSGLVSGLVSGQADVVNGLLNGQTDGSGLGSGWRFGFPAVVKTRRMGYDGKGQFVVRNESELARALEALKGQDVIVEEFVHFEREVSIIAVRGNDGAMAFYPLTVNVHRDGILRTSVVGVSPHPLQAQAEQYARAVMEALNYVGVLAIEFFEKDGRLLANEMAPRVHNSGHWTIDGAVTSQFENHVRAVAGLPLGSTQPLGAAGMVNLIGTIPEAADVLKIEGAHLHLYGKSPRPGRKVGHVNVLAENDALLAKKNEELKAVIRDH